MTTPTPKQTREAMDIVHSGEDALHVEAESGCEPAFEFAINVHCVECDSPPEDCRCDDDFMDGWQNDSDMESR